MLNLSLGDVFFLSALRIIFVRILFAVCVSDGGFMFLKLDSVSVVKCCQFALL